MPHKKPKNRYPGMGLGWRKGMRFKRKGCPSVAAARMHRREHEPMCDECRAVQRIYERLLKQVPKAERMGINMARYAEQLYHEGVTI